MQTKRNTFKYYTDPSHAWLAVKLQTLIALNLQDQISSYSYIKGKTAYLEEDLDAGIFVMRWKKTYDKIYLDVKHSDKPSPIRSYEPFTKNRALMAFKEN